VRTKLCNGSGAPVSLQTQYNNGGDDLETCFLNHTIRQSLGAVRDRITGYLSSFTVSAVKAVLQGRHNCSKTDSSNVCGAVDRYDKQRADALAEAFVYEN